MKVLVTGALGFLGRAVVRELTNAGHEVDGLFRSASDLPSLPAGSRWVLDDVLNSNALLGLARECRYDAVCHLAALTRNRDSIANPMDYWLTNTGGTLNLLHALTSNSRCTTPPRVVFASSSAVYGPQPVDVLIEDLVPAAGTPYAWSKLAGEQATRDCADTGRVSAVILRCFNLAGAVDGFTDRDPTRLVPNVLRAAHGQVPHLEVNGDGSARREFTHVGDAAVAFRLAVEAELEQPHETLNLGTGVGVSVAEVIASAERITSRRVPVQYLPPKPEPWMLVCDPTAIRKALGWEPVRSSLEEIVGDAAAVW